MAGFAISDVNLTGATIKNSNLSNIEITDCNLSGLIIDGVTAENLFEAYHKLKASKLAVEPS